MTRWLRLAFLVAALGACGDEPPAPAPLPPEVAPRPALDAPPIPPRQRAQPEDAEPYLAVRVVAAATREPIAGATVSASQVSPRDAQGLRTFHDQTATTGVDGVAHFAKPMWAGSVSFSAHAPGFALESNSVAVAWHGEAEEVFALSPGTEARGSVVDAEGRPLADALVEAERELVADDLPQLDVDARRTRTAADGSFRLEGMPLDRRYRVAARSPGHVAAGVSWCSGDGPVEIRLARGGVVSGTVRLPDGRSAADVSVDLVRRDVAFDSLEVVTDGCRTDAEGRFRIDGVDPHVQWALVARQEGYAQSAESQPFSVEAGREHALDLRLRRRSFVAMTLRDTDGAPPPRQTAWLRVGDEVRAFEADSGLEREVLAGRHAFGVETPGFRPQVVVVDVEEGARVPVDVALDRGASIEGVVVDDRGEPVGDVEVSCTDDDAWRWGAVVQSIQSADGRFRFKGLRDVEHVLAAVAKGHADARHETVAPGKPARLVAPRLATLRFRLTIPEGTIDPPYLVHVAIEARELRRNWGEGAFEFAMEPSIQRFEIRVAGFVPFRCVEEFAPAATKDLGTLALRRGALLTGVVRAPEDRPPPSDVTLRTAIGTGDESSFVIPCEAGGSFRSLVLPGECTVSADLGGGAVVTKRVALVEGEETRVELVR